MMLFDFSGFIQKLVQKHKDDAETIKQVEKIIWWFDHYVIANTSRHQIVVEDLEERINRGKELLKDFL